MPKRIPGWVARTSVRGWAWLTNPARKGLSILLMIIIIASGVLIGVEVHSNQQNQDLINGLKDTNTKLQKLNKTQQQQGRDGLKLIYEGNLTTCRATNKNNRQTLKFTHILETQFGLANKAAKLIANDPKQSKTARAEADKRVDFYNEIIDALPRPIIVNCLKVTPDPTQLAQQVRDNPGKATNTHKTNVEQSKVGVPHA